MIISELSSRSGVSPRSLRYYEQLGLVAPTRGGNGYRHYDDGDVVLVRTVRSMFDLGFSSEMVRTILPCATGDHAGVDRQTISDSIERMRDDIEDRIGDLTHTREALDDFLSRRQ